MFRKILVLLAVSATSVHASVIMPRVPVLDGRIVGGDDATIENCPYTVSVRISDIHYCGGSILNSQVVITAAHCIYSFVDASFYSVQYGTAVVGGSNNVISAQRVIKNENYDPSDISNDVGLIILDSDIPFGASAQPISLPSVAPEPGTAAVVSGWGKTVEGGSSASILQQVSVQIVERSVCKDQYHGFNDVNELMLCAGMVDGGKDACQGDSGGPLVSNGQLVGIVSWGNGCGRADFPGVYTNVAAVRNWIVSNIP